MQQGNLGSDLAIIHFSGERKSLNNRNNRGQTTILWTRLTADELCETR